MSEELNKYTVNFPPESKIGTVDCRTVNNHYYGIAKSMKKRIRYIFLGSLIVILATFGLTLKLTSIKTSEKGIHDFEPIQINEEKGGAVLRGISFYKKRNFYLALQEFNSSKDTSDFIIFYKANCLMYLTYYNEAQKCLEKIGDDNLEYKDEVEWLTALSFYYQDRIKEAIVCLTDISVKDHRYNNKASEMLSEIHGSKK